MMMAKTKGFEVQEYATDDFVDNGNRTIVEEIRKDKSLVSFLTDHTNLVFNFETNFYSSLLYREAEICEIRLYV